METFMAAYALVWLGVVLFVARMGLRMRHLQRTVEGLQSGDDGGAAEAPLRVVTHPGEESQAA